MFATLAQITKLAQQLQVVRPVGPSANDWHYVVDVKDTWSFFDKFICAARTLSFLACEQCVDIATHIVASRPLNPYPSNMRSAFSVLAGEMKVIGISLSVLGVPLLFLLMGEVVPLGAIFGSFFALEFTISLASLEAICFYVSLYLSWIASLPIGRVPRQFFWIIESPLSLLSLRCLWICSLGWTSFWDTGLASPFSSPLAEVFVVGGSILLDMCFCADTCSLFLLSVENQFLGVLLSPSPLAFGIRRPSLWADCFTQGSWHVASSRNAKYASALRQRLTFFCTKGTWFQSSAYPSQESFA